MTFQSSSSPFDVLSDRELEVLLIVAMDKTNREIAKQLAISERTVRAHVSEIIRKLGVASRVGAAVVFVEWKIHAKPARALDPHMAKKPMVDIEANMSSWSQIAEAATRCTAERITVSKR